MKRMLLAIVVCTMTITGIEAQIPNDSLSAFLVTAKKETYAKGEPSNIIEWEDGCKEIGYSEGEFRYRDRFYGEDDFSGEEIVWWENQPVWSMNYFGVTYTMDEVPDQFSDFLKESLRKIEKANPFRGPKYYKRDNFVYVNVISGDIAHFRGVEKILYKGKEIYRLYYHGGNITY